MFISIVAHDKNYGIGHYDSITGIYSIPWNCPEDKKFFKDTTTGHIVLMGYNTFKSLGEKPLPNRINIVITRNSEKTAIINSKYPDVLVFHNPLDAVKWYCTNYKNKINWIRNYESNTKLDTELDTKNTELNIKPVHCFVIGGCEIYKWFEEQKLIQICYSSVILTESDQSKCNIFYHPFSGSSYNIEYNEGCNDNCKYYKYDIINTEESQMITYMKSILDEGIIKMDRTQIGTKSLFGKQFTFDLKNNSFPLMTTRPMFIRGIFEELMLYIRGQTNSKILENNGINVWKPNTTRAFLDARGLQHLPEGDMGPSYGFLFRYFGAKYENCTTDYTGQGVDQLYQVINDIKFNPQSRRMIISLWDPLELNKCPLPPCLYNYQFYVNEDIIDDTHVKYLSCMMTQRSSDYVVAGGWNVSTGALLTIMLAKITGCKPDKLIWNIGDAHLYLNNIDAAGEQSTRVPYCYPKLFLKHKEKIEDFCFEDLELIGYCNSRYPQIELMMNA